MTQNTHKAFSLIELIFVIVIIGILASIAIPKFTGTASSATAAKCTQAVGQFVREASAQYNRLGYTAFQDLTIAEATNIATGVGTSGSSGLESAGTALIKDGSFYMCAGLPTVKFTFETNATLSSYKLVLKDENPINQPAAKLAAEAIRKNFGIAVAAGKREFEL